MTDLDPDRILALAYVPAARRPALDALWRLDATLGAVLATGSDAMVTRIRLAWWREALERLDREPAPPEPLLQALAADALPIGLKGAELAAMEEGWEALVGPAAPLAAELDRYAEMRGACLFRLSARVLGDAAFPVDAAGRRWALLDLARRSSAPAERQAALGAAPPIGEEERWPAMLRPLGMLDSLALSDMNSRQLGMPGSPSRMLRMIRHRLTGR